jgi:2-polyprenyl-3-methyl-5-hydroxy-6-metoxy-1,4-benzoquinol methylase
MASLKDDRGYNQMFKPSIAMEIRSKRRANMIVSEMNISSKTEILEIGCGTGEIAFFIANETKANVLATDLCIPFIEEAKIKFKNVHNLSFDCLNFNNPDSLLGRKFDYIIGNGILHHLYNNLDETLENIYFLLKKDGKLIFLEPNIYNPYCLLIFKSNYFRKIANLEPDEMAFSKKFIFKKLQAAKYQNIKINFRDFLIPITPSYLVSFVIYIGSILEKIPLLNKMSQSIFIIGQKSNYD